MARLVGFEPTTFGFEVHCSIQLSYKRMFVGRMTRLELVTTGATIRGSTKLSYIRHIYRDLVRPRGFEPLTY
jgi:hypothetical protein